MIRILLTYDTEGWACWSECHAIAKWLHRFADEKITVDIGRADCSTEASLARYDLVFSTVYYGLRDSHHPCSVSQISSPSYFVRKDKQSEGFPSALRLWRHLVVKNRELMARLDDEDHPRRSLLYHCLDVDFFSPAESGHRQPNGTFRVGFAGHAEQSFKGYDLVREACDRTANVELVAVSWHDRIPHHQMPAFYRSLDAFVCVSKPGEDAGPRPPMEAALCGCPVITTDVGQAGEMFTDGDTALVVDRDAHSIEMAIRLMMGDAKLRRHLARRGRLAVSTKWGCDVGESWWRYFKGILDDN